MEKDSKTESSDNNVDDHDHNKNQISFKIIVIGDSGVGKTSITSQVIRKSFDEKHNSTIGFEFYTYDVKIEDKIIKLQIWDTCGQELYRSLISNFYKQTSLAILVYSIDSEEYFHSLNNWVNEIKAKANPDILFVLIGNKIDLEDEDKENRKISKEMGDEFCKDNNFSFFFFISLD